MTQTCHAAFPHVSVDQAIIGVPNWDQSLYVEAQSHQQVPYAMSAQLSAHLSHCKLPLCPAVMHSLSSTAPCSALHLVGNRHDLQSAILPDTVYGLEHVVTLLIAGATV